MSWIKDRSVVLCLLAVAAGPWAAPSAALAGGKGGIVYYQVSYKDGGIRDLSDPPKTDKGIDRVVRISRFESGTTGYEILSTGPRPLTLVATGRTIRTQLVWNGKAWVAPDRPAKSRKTKAAAPPRKSSQDAVAQEIKRLQQILNNLRGRLKDCDHIVAQGRRDLKKTKDAKQAAAIDKRIALGERDRELCLEAVKLYETQLAALKTVIKEGHLAKPAGKIRVSPRCPLADGAGVRKLVAGKRVLPHRTQVWKLPPGKGERTYEISISHPEAGRLGAFHYVAYADTDGSGKPDKLLACSPLAVAQTPGGWSCWKFTTTHPVVFIGQTWARADTTVSCRRTDDVSANWKGLSREIYVSGFFGGMPTTRQFWPYLSNVRVRIPLPNPDVELN